MADDSFWGNLERRLGSLPGASGTKLEGATDDEIASVEKYAGRPLPKIYRDFLNRMGRFAGKLFAGSDYSVTERHHLQFREYADRLLRNRQSTLVLPEDAFVFLMHQGYQFLFISLDQGDDPPVFLVTERDPYPKRMSDHFSSYIDRYVNDLEQLVTTHPELFGGDDGSDVNGNNG